MEKNNTLTRQSTNESGDSDNSCNPQFYNGNNTPNCMRNYQQSQLNMMHYPHVKKINFNNFGGYNGSNYNYNPTQYYTTNNFSQNHEPNLGNTINNNFQINICQTQQKINFQNLPENAFSFNIDNLPSLKKLKDLDLSTNSIPDSEVKQIAVYKSLINLSIADNQI